MSEETENIKKKKMEQLLERVKGSSKMPGKPVQVTDSDMHDVVQQHPLVVVDCWAPWCGPCRMLSPIIEDLASDMQGDVVFAKLNTDENQQTAKQYGIMSIPTLLLFKDGELIDQQMGALPKDMLRSWIERYT
ncbi:MAG: thioredoxin [Thermoplasmatota archaeon]